MPKPTPQDSPAAPAKKSWRRRIVVAAIKLVVVVAGVAVVAPCATMVLHGMAAQPQKSDVILVPGAALANGGRDLSDALRYRMNTAIDLWRRGYAPRMVLSGGGEGRWDEAAAMARYAEERGVPASALVLDRAGVNTRATAENLATVLRESGAGTVALRPVPFDKLRDTALASAREDDVIRAAREVLREFEPAGARVLVVSQWCHVPRVRMALQQAGFRSFGAACEHPRFLHNEHWMAAREAVGLWAYAFRAESGAWRERIGAE